MTPAEDDELRRVLEGSVGRRGSERTTTLGAGGFDLDAGRGYLAATRPGGFGVPSWPRHLGGRDADPDEAAHIKAFQADFAIPDLYPYRVGMRMVGPTLLEHGTTDQQWRWMPAIAAGDAIWCQMFSEPEAGSDLANVSTSARRDGDLWSLDGQKVWTSRAEYATWGICLARTAPEAPKHRGLTMFAVRMDAPGIDVRPLTQINGDAHFSEVFLTAATVPDTDRIGDVGGGWRVATALLAHERAGADRSAPKVGPSAWPTWLDDLVQAGLSSDRVLRDRAMALYCLDEAIRFTELRALANEQAGRQPGPEGSGMKLHGARSFKLRSELLAAGAGAAAMLTDWHGHVDFLTAPSMSIRGGTDEIQRNILGERVLGLPGEPRVDRDVPWSVSRRGARPS